MKKLGILLLLFNFACAVQRKDTKVEYIDSTIDSLSIQKDSFSNEIHFFEADSVIITESPSEKGTFRVIKYYKPKTQSTKSVQQAIVSKKVVAKLKSKTKTKQVKSVSYYRYLWLLLLIPIIYVVRHYKRTFEGVIKFGRGLIK